MILYVEDDYIIRQEIKDILLKSGRIVYTARNATEARSLFNENDINLLVTDIKLPDGDGTVLAKEFRQIKPELKVIILTAFEAFFFDLNQIKADAFLMKPVYRENFINTVNEILEDGKHTVE